MAEGFDASKVRMRNVFVEVIFGPTKANLVWKYFGNLMIDDENGEFYHYRSDRYFCNECYKIAKSQGDDTLFLSQFIKYYSTSTSTGNLYRHLKEKHKIIVKEIKKSSTTIKSYFTPGVAVPRNSSTSTSKQAAAKKKLAIDFVMLCCRDLLPFSVAQGEGMKDFLKKNHIVVQNEEIPSSTTISRTLDTVYEHLKAVVKDEITKNSPKNVSVTFDQWTDKYRRRPYNTVTLHYWDSAFNPVNMTLRTTHFPKRHSGENIIAEIDLVLNEFNLQNKKVHMVTDAARNVQRACRLGKYDNFLCLGHGLHNLVVTDGFKKTSTISNLLTKVREIVKALRFKTTEFENVSSELETLASNVTHVNDNVFDLEEPADSDEDLSDGEEDAADEQFEVNDILTEKSRPEQPNTLKLDVKTRWHSQLTMPESVNLRNKSAINLLLQRLNKTDLCLTRADMELMNQLCKFLQNFKKITEVFSGDEYSTVNMAALFHCEIFHLLEDNVGDSTEIRELKQNMKRKFNYRFPLTDLHIVAALLDPRFQNLLIVKQYLTTKNITAIELIKRWISQCGLQSNETAPTNRTESKEKSYVDKLIEKHTTLASIARTQHSQNDIERECHQLFSMGGIVKITSIHEFWEGQLKTMPILAELSRLILSIPMTSTPSERNFSIAGLIANSRRSSILPSNLDKVLFIHNNYELLKKVAEQIALD